MTCIWDILPGHPDHPQPARTPGSPVRPPRQRHRVVADPDVPKSLAALWAIVEADREIACSEILELVMRLRRWLRGDRGRISMNRTFSVWQGRSPHKVAAMVRWARRPDVAARFARDDAAWALTELRLGLLRVTRGEIADAAFGQCPPATRRRPVPSRR